jgi:hypothetical protein
VRLADGPVRADPGALVAQQQRDRLELRARRGRHPAVAQGGLDLPDGAGEHRHDVVAVAAATSVARGATASPGLGLASSSH